MIHGKDTVGPWTAHNAPSVDACTFLPQMKEATSGKNTAVGTVTTLLTSCPDTAPRSAIAGTVTLSCMTGLEKGL